MAPTKASIYKIYNAGSRKFSPLKNTIKFLSFCQDKRIHKDILSRAPPIVIKRICDAALNAREGQVKLSKKQKDILTRHRKTIEQLLQKAIPVERKKDSCSAWWRNRCSTYFNNSLLGFGSAW